MTLAGDRCPAAIILKAPLTVWAIAGYRIMTFTTLDGEELLVISPLLLDSSRVLLGDQPNPAG